MVNNSKQTLTNGAGIPVPSNTVSKSVGKQSPLLLEDYTLHIADSLGKCSEVVIKDQMQLFRNVYPVLADKVQEEMANPQPPKPEPKPATV